MPVLADPLNSVRSAPGRAVGRVRQELTFADETSCCRGHLFLPDERIFSGPMLPIASRVNRLF